MFSPEIVELLKQKKRNESIPNSSEAKYDESNSHQKNFPFSISRPSSISVPGAPFTHPRNNVPF